MNKDYGSQLSKARDEWFESDEGKVCQQTNIPSGPSQQQFLRNRLEAAFIAGANWCAIHLKNELSRVE